MRAWLGVTWGEGGRAIAVATGRLPGVKVSMRAKIKRLIGCLDLVFFKAP